MATQTVNPRITELVAYIDWQREELLAAVESVPDAHRRTRPTPDAWCVAEVLEHLALVERRLGAMFAMRFAEARANGVGPDHVSKPILDEIDSQRVMDRTRRIKTNEATMP